MRSRFRGALEFAVENSLLMVLGTVIALIWANLDAAGYEAAVHPVHFAVNDIGMVFFFGMAVTDSAPSRSSSSAGQTSRDGGARLRLVGQMRANWNQIAFWLRQPEELRDAGTS